MGKFTKPQYPHHRFRLRSDANDGEMLLVLGGRNAYLWAGRDGNNPVVTFSGQQTLRKLAQEILKEVPARKPRKKK